MAGFIARQSHLYDGDSFTEKDVIFKSKGPTIFNIQNNSSNGTERHFFNNTVQVSIKNVWMNYMDNG